MEVSDEFMDALKEGKVTLKPSDELVDAYRIEDPTVRLVQAALEIGQDGVLNDPSDEDIVLAAAELAFGNWPKQGVTTEQRIRILSAWTKGDDTYQAT